MQTLQFGVVFKVPKGTEQIKLTGKVLAEPDFGWLTANLRDVFECLSEKLQRILRLNKEAREGKNRLPIGDYEKWVLDLTRC